MKRYIVKIMMCMALGIGIGGCASSFLDVPPYSQMSPDDYFSSSSDAPTSLVNAVYNALLQTNMHGFPWIGVASITSDDASKGSSPGDTGTDKQDLDNFTFTADAISFDNVWEANYIGIIRANYALSTLPTLGIDKEKEKRLVGEASFLRAYFYWNLWRCFGGVPLITFVPDPSDEEQQKLSRTRATSMQVYNHILSDLDVAVESLPALSYLPALELGRATSGAALALRSKVYLYGGHWEEAARDARSVISQEVYDLSTPYEDIWKEVGENTTGSIFEVQCRGLTPATAIGGFTETQGIRGMYGWGFNTPTEDLRSIYDANDVRDDAIFIEAGQTLWDGVQVISPTENTYYNYKAYVSKHSESATEDSWQSNKNYRVLRYADVLLILCEALWNIDPQNEEIYTYLSSIRQRAGLMPVTADDYATSQDLLDAILLERRREMAMEYDRFFDLIRQGRLYDPLIPISALGEGKNPNSRFSWPRNALFPIPARQIQLSGGSLTQNPEY